MGQGTDPTLNLDQAASDKTPTLDSEAGNSDPGAQLPGKEDPPANQEHDFEKRFSDLRTHSQGQDTAIKEKDATITALQEQNQILNFQAQTQQNPPVAPAAPVQPVTQPVVQPTAQEGLLSTAEQTQLTTARENFDNSEINRLSEIQATRAADRAATSANQKLISGLTEQATIQNVINEVNAAPEIKDEAVSRKLLLETMAAQRDPVQSSKYGAGQWNVNGMIINPHIFLDKLKDYRISKGAALNKADKSAADSAHLDLGSEPGSDTALPATDQTFNANVHLTETQRSAVRKAMHRQGTQFSGMTDTNSAYRKYWDGKDKGEQNRLLKHGSREQSETGKTGGAIWRAGEKKK